MKALLRPRRRRVLAPDQRPRPPLDADEHDPLSQPPEPDSTAVLRYVGRLQPFGQLVAALTAIEIVLPLWMQRYARRSVRVADWISSALSAVHGLLAGGEWRRVEQPWDANPHSSRTALFTGFPHNVDMLQDAATAFIESRREALRDETTQIVRRSVAEWIMFRTGAEYARWSVWNALELPVEPSELPATQEFLRLWWGAVRDRLRVRDALEELPAAPRGHIRVFYPTSRPYYTHLRPERPALRRQFQFGTSRPSSHPEDVGVWVYPDEDVARTVAFAIADRYSGEVPVVQAATAYLENPRVYELYDEFLADYRGANQDIRTLRRRLLRRHDSLVILRLPESRHTSGEVVAIVLLNPQDVRGWEIVYPEDSDA